MSDIQSFQLAPLGIVEYAECLGGGGDPYSCSPLGEFVDLLTSFFSGQPKLVDTIEAQQRLAQSHLWQFKALAANLEIWVRNGVPLSTGNPQYRAQLTGWIAGTLRGSGLGLTEAQIAQADTTLWQVFNSHIQLPVKALDNLITGFQRVNSIRPPPPIPPPPPPPIPPPVPPPPGGGGDNGDLIKELIACLCDETSDECCTAVVSAIAQVAAQLAAIASTLASGGRQQVPNPPTIDLSGITTALNELVAAIGAYPPALQACCAAINTSLGNIATAISSAPGADTKGIVDALNKILAQGDVDNAIFQALQQQGTLSAEDLQTLQGIKWSDALSYIISSAPWRTFQKIGKVVEADYDAINQAVIGYSAAADHWAAKEARKGLTTQRNLLQSAITPILDAVKSALQPNGVKQIGQIGVNPDTVLADVAAVALNVQAIATLISLAREGAGEQISKIGEYAAGLLGFEELREVQLGPLVDFGIARIAEMQAKKLFAQELPGAGALAALQARGLITGAQYFNWVPYTGLPGELWEQTRESAYSGLGARRILPLIQTGLFSQADIADELRFSGLRPASMQRYLAAAPYLATQTERRSLISSLEKAYAAGLLADADLTGNIDSAENNTTRDNLILQRVKWEALIVETKALEAEYTTLYLGQVIDDATFRGYLGGIGLQPWMISVAAAKAEARLNATLHRKELAAAAALERATAAEERKAAMRNFTMGNIDAGALGIALIATGLTATQAAAWVDLAVLQKVGSLRWKFGLQLTAAEATLLGQRVTALTDQRKRQQISDAQYVSALEALNIPPNFINALRATADALLTPAKTAFAIPVQTG